MFGNVDKSASRTGRLQLDTQLPSPTMEDHFEIPEDSMRHIEALLARHHPHQIQRMFAQTLESRESFNFCYRSRALSSHLISLSVCVLNHHYRRRRRCHGGRAGGGSAFLFLPLFSVWLIHVMCRPKFYSLVVHVHKHHEFIRHFIFRVVLAVKIIDCIDIFLG